jgi:hypothetical protein
MKKGYAEGGSAEKDTYDKSSFVNVFREEGKKFGSKLMTPRETLVELVLGKLDNPKDSKSVSKEDKKKVKKVMKRKGGGSAMKKKGYSKGGAMKRKGGGSVLNKKGYAKGGAARIF